MYICKNRDRKYALPKGPQQLFKPNPSGSDWFSPYCPNSRMLKISSLALTHGRLVCNMLAQVTYAHNDHASKCISYCPTTWHSQGQLHSPGKAKHRKVKFLILTKPKLPWNNILILVSYTLFLHFFVHFGLGSEIWYYYRTGGNLNSSNQTEWQSGFRCQLNPPQFLMCSVLQHYASVTSLQDASLEGASCPLWLKQSLHFL